MKPSILTWPSGRLDFSKGALITGILNVTPDSFSDGGRFFDAEKAVAHGVEMAKAGAAIIDVGAESTRPGSKPVGTKEQIKMAIPVIKRLAGVIDIPISIDTYNAEVAAAALDAGAAVINDITALSDERMATLAARRQVPVVLMHMLGTPETMQDNPSYNNVVGEVADFLLERAQKAQELGIAADRIFIDPGIGFGKTTEHNLLLLRNLAVFVKTGWRVLVGVSRKRFIGELTGKDNPDDRMFGTAAAVALAVSAGVSIVRVHDVAAMADVVKVAKAIVGKL